jgi:hypothetical protein
MGRRAKKIHKELQNLDPLYSPHLEEIWIGGNIDLPLTFPAKICKNHERN